MYIDPTWRVLTVGDGDLSFSASLMNVHQLKNITSSVFDSEDHVRDKYKVHEIDRLRSVGVDIHFELDVTDPTSFCSSLLHKFDLVIFQFPLSPNRRCNPAASDSQFINSNLANRYLIVKFLAHSADYLHDPQGAKMSYVTSKDVKPYSDWQLESLFPLPKNVHYCGYTEFDMEQYPGYRLRNVDRDKTVKATASKTFVWGVREEVSKLRELHLPCSGQWHCDICQIDSITNQRDLQEHQQSKSHQRRVAYNEQWHQLVCNLSLNSD